MQTEHMKITGMSCGGCTSKITQALKAVPGVGEATMSLAPGEATIEYDEHLTSPAQLEAAVTAAGYGVKDVAAGNTRVSGGCRCN